ncbi:MAG TPA: RNA polymerase sigma factor [Gemmatimonadaceae bacterium]|nr:RNA polymerase sigma factor [Gemmatimonadaceae bacterium]
MTDSFSDALQPCYADALRFCRALCARWSPSEAEDVLHDALLKALRGYDRLEDPTRFRAWLFQIIVRTFRGAARRGFWRRLVSLQELPSGEAFPEVFHGPEWCEDRLSLLGALATLSPKERAAVLLFEVGGFSIDEIAEIQGERTHSAVKSRLSRARSRLRKQLGTHSAPRAAATNARRSTCNRTLDHETLDAINNVY